MRILLVDDEELQLLRLTEAVKKALPADNVFLSYANPVLAWEENKETPVDIAFLDIDMPVINGILLAKKLKTVNPQVNVIFVTAYNEYALDAYKLHASGYVTKPVNLEKIQEELDGLRYPVEMKSTKKLQVKCFGNFEVFAEKEQRTLRLSYRPRRRRRQRQRTQRHFVGRGQKVLFPQSDRRYSSLAESRGRRRRLYQTPKRVFCRRKQNRLRRVRIPKRQPGRHPYVPRRIYGAIQLGDFRRLNLYPKFLTIR